MVDAVHLSEAASGSSRHHWHHPAHANDQARAPVSFRQVLLRALQGKAATGRFLNGVHHGVHQAVDRIPVLGPLKAAATVPAESSQALSQAMALEGVPESWRSGLTFIMAHESGGQVGAHSPIHSARGLYQLTAANYHYNPNGTASFGNAVEEAQGGIRYIRARYGNADNAVAFWRRHRWY